MNWKPLHVSNVMPLMDLPTFKQREHPIIDVSLMSQATSSAISFIALKNFDWLDSTLLKMRKFITRAPPTGLTFY